MVKGNHGSWFKNYGSGFMVHGYLPLPFTFSFNVFTIEVRILRILSISCFSELNWSMFVLKCQESRVKRRGSRVESQESRVKSRESGGESLEARG